VAILGELVFIGLGLHDEYGLSLRGQLVAKSCDVLFGEFYTSQMPGLSISRLEELVGKKVQMLSRRQVEEDAEKIILSKAKTGRVGLLVPGDPLVATTHVDLRLRALRAGVSSRIVHAASVVSAAAGSTGLQSYKFGRTATVPIAHEGDFPKSVIEVIARNLAMGLHSLVLLEIDVENNQFVSIPTALKLLSSTSETMGERISRDTLVVGVARLESQDMKVMGGRVSEVMRMDFGEPPYVLIFPGSLHFVEAEALQLFCHAPKELVSS
jgi:diphthine synthase